MTATQNDVYAVLQPPQQQFAAVFSSPHSGCTYPLEFLRSTALDARALRSSEDCYIDELFAGVVALGCPLLSARFPRAYLDVNREPYELDPAMFADALPAYCNTTSLRVAGGLGTIPRVVSENKPIYDHKLKWADAKQRIEALYHPYHAAVQEMIETTRARFGSALLVDCHSMPSTAVRQSALRNAHRTDVVIGDRYGATCDPDVSTFLAELFNKAGLRTVRNKPYAGGYITQAYGRSGHPKQALQIELNRRLYMNEQTLERSGEFNDFRERLTGVMQSFLTGTAGSHVITALAAE
jgi:N-formylglutamate amidohydrolase